MSVIFALWLAGALATVPDVVGMPILHAKSKIASAGLALGRITEESAPCPERWTVLRQSPAAGAQVAKTAAVSLQEEE